MAKRRRGPSRVIKKNPHKINREIRAEDVRLVGDGGAEIVSLKEALAEADSQELDLVLMGPNATPPVVKIMDYSKFLYEQNKKKPQAKPKPMKEVRFTPNTDDNDVKFKSNHIINFLSKGHKVKVFVFFKGRQMAFKERGEELLLKLAVDLEDHATVENMPKMEGRKMNMILKPKTKKETKEG